MSAKSSTKAAIKTRTRTLAVLEAAFEHRDMSALVGKAHEGHQSAVLRAHVVISHAQVIAVAVETQLLRYRYWAQVKNNE